MHAVVEVVVGVGMVPAANGREEVGESVAAHVEGLKHPRLQNRVREG